MEYIEDYDEECVKFVKTIERLFKEWKNQADADKAGHLESIRSRIQKLRQLCTLYKSDLYLVPRAQEQEYRAKYDSYIDKIGKYETAVKKMELILKDDRQGLMELKYGIDPERFNDLNDETKRLASHGFKTQAKSEEALLRIEKRVGDVQNLADSNLGAINKQNEQILRINDQLQRMEGTMTRTKRLLGVFAKSFCTDKVALCECCLIVVTACLIIAATQLNSRN